MHDALIMIGVTVVAFVSTNLDNLFVLMGLVGGSKMQTRDVATAYAFSIAVVLGIGVAASYLADLGADAWLRYLGFVPLGMGLWRIRALATGARSPGASPEQTRSGLSIPSVSITMLASSGDSLGVFSSLMAETSEVLVLVIFATALAMSALWAAAASFVVQHPALAPRLRMMDRYAVPILLVAIGLYILSDTATDTI